MYAYKHHPDMRPSQSLMVSDKALTVLWNQCRLIGIINKICIYFITVLLVMYLLLLVTPIDFPYCKHDDNKWQKMYEMYHSVKNQTSVITEVWKIIIFICLFLAFLIKMTFVNNGLISTDMPTDGNKVNSWLRWHIDFFVISVVTFVGILFKGLACYSTDTIISHYIPLKLGITIMVLMIEINVVRKFNKEFEISANHRNRKLVLLNI